jgi:hypothetical protein
MAIVFQRVKQGHLEWILFMRRLGVSPKQYREHFKSLPVHESRERRGGEAER